MCIFVLVFESNIIDIIGHDQEVLNGDATGEGCKIYCIYMVYLCNYFLLCDFIL